jgi:predicted permease
LTKVSKILTGKTPQFFWISKNFKEKPPGWKTYIFIIIIIIIISLGFFLGFFFSQFLNLKKTKKTQTFTLKLTFPG